MSGRDDLPLDELGVVQAELVAKRLLPSLTDDSVIWTSPLRRARATAAAIAQHRLVLIAEALTEIDCGSADGLSLGEVERRFPRAWAANRRQDDDAFRWPGGESYLEFRARVVDWTQRIVTQYAGRDVIVVTHAGVISQLLGTISGTRPACWSAGRPGNASLTVLTCEAGRWRVLAFDDRAHLADVEGTQHQNAAALRTTRAAALA